MQRVVAAVVAVLLVSCAHDLWISDRLFFGRSIPGGGVVSDEELAAFVRDVVTPRFPDGLTVYEAYGQWREPSGEVVRERATVIEILHPRSAEADRAIDEILRAYRERFRQEAVLRVRSRAAVRFTGGP